MPNCPKTNEGGTSVKLWGNQAAMCWQGRSGRGLFSLLPGTDWLADWPWELTLSDCAVFLFELRHVLTAALNAEVQRETERQIHTCLTARQTQGVCYTTPQTGTQTERKVLRNSPKPPSDAISNSQLQSSVRKEKVHFKMCGHLKYEASRPHPCTSL